MSGWSAIGGQTGNAYDPKRNPSGSSSGSANRCSTQFLHRRHRHGNGRFYFCRRPRLTESSDSKPTQTRVSGRGVIPLSPRQDVAGPMGRNVADVAIVAASLFDQSFEIAPILSARGDQLKGKRVGWWPGSPNLRPDVLVRCHRVRDLMVGEWRRSRRAHSTDRFCSNLALLSFSPYCTNFKHAINAYLGDLEPARREVQSLEGLIEFNRREAAREMPFFGKKYSNNRLRAAH